MNGRRVQDTLGSLLVLALLLGLWWLAAHGQWVSKAFLPTPEATLAHARSMLTAAQIPTEIIDLCRHLRLSDRPAGI